MSTRADFRRRKKISKRLEEKVAKEVGGDTTAGSGAAEFSGGADVRVAGEMRIEHKYTEGDSYVLKYADLEKLRMQAIKGGLEEPVFVVEFLKWKMGFAITPHILCPDQSYGFINEPKGKFYKSVTLKVLDLKEKMAKYDHLSIVWVHPDGGDTKWHCVKTWEDFLNDRAAHD
jgi:hypothetical protein